MGKEMHADTRQMGCDLDYRSASTHRTDQGGVAGAAFAPIQFPLHPQPVEMADTHCYRNLTLGHLVEHHTAWALRVLVEHLPHKGYRNGSKLSPSLKRWTCTLSEGMLAQGEGHDFILLAICCRMKSALLPLEGKGHFYPQENQ
jgi:hypothetical protein